jgi:outer membrane lipoprotein-sorting protein
MRFLIIVSLFAAVCIPDLFPITGDEVIARVDELMNTDSRVEMVLVKQSLSGEELEHEEMTVYAKNNNQKIIVRITYPQDRIGNDIIMIEENVWSYDMDSGRVIRVPSNLSYGGTDFSYGDIVRLNLSDNYNAQITGEDTEFWAISLSAEERSAPYHRIEMKIQKETFIPVTGICFSRNGEIIKTMEYSDVREFNGKMKPSVITVSSPYNNDDVSVMTIISEELKIYPDNIYNKRNLAMRLEENY